MKKATRLFVLSAIGLMVGSLPLTAQAKKQTDTIVLESDTNTQTSPGTKQLVTNHVLTGLTQPSDGSTPESVSIPKNTAFTIVKKTSAGTLIKVPGSQQTLLVAKTQGVVYSNKAIKLTKKDYQQLVKRSKAWAGKLSKRQLKAIGNYTGDGSDELNNALRYPNRKTTKKTRQQVKDLAASLKTFKLTHPMTVYRGTSNKIVKLSLHHATLKPGAVYADPGFASTSTSHKVATSFTSQVLLKITFPKGYHGAYLDPISTFQGEKEYLLNPNTKLVVTKVQKVTGTQSLHMTEVKGKKTTTHNAHQKLHYKLITLNLLQ